MNLIVSYAHEWVDALPVGAGIVKCTRCGVKTYIREFNQAPRCQKHYESQTSGFRDEGEHDD